MDSSFRWNDELMSASIAVHLPPPARPRLLSGCATRRRAAAHFRRLHAAGAGRCRCEPSNPHRRRPAALPRPRASSSAVSSWAIRRWSHNYGHGGGGITLSWGSSKLATELGLQGHSGPVAVLGSGVMGLSTARLAAGGRLPGHHLRCRSSARHDVEHRRRPVPPFRRVPRGCASTPRVQGAVRARARL